MYGNLTGNRAAIGTDMVDRQMGQHEGKEEAADRFSLRGRVFHRLREDILSGKYPENVELKEAALGEEMGVSRTPVREALRQLELEGLVTIVPNRGAFVTGITRKDMQDIYAMRALLEGMCARWAVQRITKEQMEALEETVFLSWYHVCKHNTEQLTGLDNQFHEILYEACGSRMLKHQLKDYHEYVMRVRKRVLSDNERGREAVQEHRQIMEAIQEKDADRAEELATLHIRNAYANMVKNGIL